MLDENAALVGRAVHHDVANSEIDKATPLTVLIDPKFCQYAKSTSSL